MLTLLHKTGRLHGRWIGIRATRHGRRNVRRRPSITTAVRRDLAAIGTSTKNKTTTPPPPTRKETTCQLRHAHTHKREWKKKAGKIKEKRVSNYFCNKIIKLEVFFSLGVKNANIGLGPGSAMFG